MYTKGNSWTYPSVASEETPIYACILVSLSFLCLRKRGWKITELYGGPPSTLFPFNLLFLFLFLQGSKAAISHHMNIKMVSIRLMGLTNLLLLLNYVIHRAHSNLVRSCWDTEHDTTSHSTAQYGREDGHPHGLLKHQAEMASFSYLIIRAANKLLNVIYAYKVAKGWSAKIRPKKRVCRSDV